jgi:glutamate dehydrogenase (NAD(P)+)
MEDLFRFSDELGPNKILHIYEPSVNLKAILVVDNIALGPSIGGIRVAPDVSVEECFRLARAMTLKNSSAGLPHGGGKAVVFADPKQPKADKQKLLRCLASALRNIEEYILAPDMGTDEECMGWIRDECGRVVGLPRELGGIPLDELGATGFGLRHATDVALEFCDFELAGARVVIQGFGAVGQHAARHLAAGGARILAVADSGGAVYAPGGLDLEALFAHKHSGKSVTNFPAGEPIDRDGVIDVECDIWIPAARPDVINEQNVARLRSKLIVQGANIPLTSGAESYLHERGVLCVPDFIANAGGVICAAMEYHGASQGAAFQSIEEKVRENTRAVLDCAKREQSLPRKAAVALAVERVKKVMSMRRWSLFSMGPHYI